MISRAALSLAIGLVFATNAAAQLASQTALVGTVTDTGNLLVPGAQVVAVNVGTKDTYEATTNAEGYYNIQFVRTGKYDITVTVAGFQTFKASGVEVGNNQVVRTNAVMKVGGVSESVNVEASAQVLNTDSAVVSETIGTRAIVDLPVSGRNVWSLASTTPGVLGGLNSDIGLSFRGAGQREIQNSLALDGINSSSNLLAATSMRPIADAVEEVQVQTGSTSAEYGSYLGVHINVVTKSGTNSPHGSAVLFLPGRRARLAGLLREPGAAEEPAPAQSDRPADGRPRGAPEALRRPQQDVLHGRVRRRALGRLHDPVQLGADRADAPGQLLRDHHAYQEPADRRELLRQHHPVDAAVVRRVAAAAVLSGAEPAGHDARRQQPAEPERDQGRERSGARPRRSERRQQDPALGPLQLVRHLQQQHRRDSCPGDHAAAGQQEHARCPTRTRWRRTCTTIFGSGITASTSTR